jgi:hypothetical protein
VNHYLNAEAMHPDIPEDGDLTTLIAGRSHRGTVRSAAPSIKQRPRTRLDPVEARSLVGLTGLTTIVAIMRTPNSWPPHSSQCDDTARRSSSSLAPASSAPL